ncbi:hypothetical protein [Marinobacterium rhizophilum]|uniref:hypothetical protein n=1 Tax=Marinobacterium rhizophilum TaxID=420402 RepID=UPI0003803553|nr:hypothetical protein [Marinobacterium rhizophilum]
MLQALYNLRLPVFLCCVAGLLYGIFRAAPPPDLFDQSDKGGHLLAFGALGLSSRLAFLRQPGLVLWPTLVSLAPLLEWLQHQLRPLRIYSLEDVWPIWPVLRWRWRFIPAPMAIITTAWDVFTNGSMCLHLLGTLLPVRPAKRHGVLIEWR